MTKKSTWNNNHCKLFKKQKKNINNNKAKNFHQHLPIASAPGRALLTMFYCFVWFVLKVTKQDYLLFCTGLLDTLIDFIIWAISLTFNWHLTVHDLSWSDKKYVKIYLGIQYMCGREQKRNFRWKQHQNYPWHNHFHMFQVFKNIKTEKSTTPTLLQYLRQ